MPLPASPLPDSAGMPGVPPTCHQGRTQPMTSSPAGEGRQRPPPTERPAMHRHSAGTSE